MQHLRKPPSIKPGGLCKIYFFKIEDVETWPAIHQVDGVIKDSVVLKEGATLYICEATEKDKTFTEAGKESNLGDYMEMQVTTNLAGNTVNNTLGLAAMKYSQFGLIINDRNGEQRLIGNKDAGAKLIFTYTSGDLGSSRYRNLSWKYQHPLPAPIYMGGTVILDDESNVFSALTLLARFRVGAAGAPMEDGDTIYQNDLLINSQFIWLADGKAIHQLSDDPDQRYASKTFFSDTITVHGGVTDGEVMEIYKF